MVIAVYDSGLGGLSVWRELIKLNVPLLYFGDTANAPYGEKTSEELQTYFWEIADLLQSRDCRGMIIACNTASALVLPYIQTTPFPVLGIIEAGVQSCLEVGEGRLGVLATNATIRNGIYQKTFAKKAPSWEVFVQAAPRLAPLVEEGKLADPSTKSYVQEYLRPLLAEKIDTLLLGCTHYPFLQPLLRELVGSYIRIVDPAPTLALQVEKWLRELDVASRSAEIEHEFWVSAHPKRFRTLAQCLLKTRIPPVGLHELGLSKLRLRNQAFSLRSTSGW